MSQFWKQLHSSRILRMRFFLRSQLCRVVDFNISFWARWTWNMIWSLKHGFHPPFPCWRHMSKLVCLCLNLWVGWGVKFECHVCWGWAQGFCLRWSMLSPYRCSACTGIDVFEWCILRQMGGLTWLRGVQQHGGLARWQTDEVNWNYINDMQWMASWFCFNLQLVK